MRFINRVSNSVELNDPVILQFLQVMEKASILLSYNSSEPIKSPPLLTIPHQLLEKYHHLIQTIMIYTRLKIVCATQTVENHEL